MIDWFKTFILHTTRVLEDVPAFLRVPMQTEVTRLGADRGRRRASMALHHVTGLFA